MCPLQELLDTPNPLSPAQSGAPMLGTAAHMHWPQRGRKAEHRNCMRPPTPPPSPLPP